MADINVELGEVYPWKNSACCRCGAKPTDAVLNIEAMIHHNEKELRCVDSTACKKRMKKKKK